MSAHRGAAMVAAAIFAMVAAGPLAAEGGRWVGPRTLEERVETGQPVDLVDATTPAADEALPDAVEAGGVTEPPGDFLMDPEGRLSRQAAEKRLAFLRDHAEESGIEIFVYLTGGRIGEAEEMAVAGLFADRRAAVVGYVWKDPQRASLYLAPPLVDAVPESEQRRALQSSVMQAAETPEPEAQLAAFLEQLSIRLYWMEQMLEDNMPAVAPAVVVVDDAAEDVGASAPQIDWQRDWLLALALAVVPVGLAVAWWWVRRRARYRFPEFEVEPRLGGQHAAGVGGVIAFLNANVPPAAQRDQVLDDLRRP